MTRRLARLSLELVPKYRAPQLNWIANQLNELLSLADNRLTARGE